MDAMLKTENLLFRYGEAPEGNQADDRPLVLNQINLTIEAGSFVSILGHNGSGKSTLSKEFNAILLPEGGKVFVAGMDTENDDLLYEIRQTAGMVFQNPDNQLVATIVEEDVAFGPENMGVPPLEIRKRVDQSLKEVDMFSFKDREPSRLSGGQKQRVAIAGVIAMHPRCIILDEPTAMLDPKGRKEVLSTIHALNQTQGITIVLITHFMNEAAESDRVIVMDDGSILLDGTPMEVFSHVKELHRVGLDVPQTTELCHDLALKGIAVRTDVLTVEECVDAIATSYEQRQGGK